MPSLNAKDTLVTVVEPRTLPEPPIAVALLMIPEPPDLMLVGACDETAVALPDFQYAHAVSPALVRFAGMVGEAMGFPVRTAANTSLDSAQQTARAPAIARTRELRSYKADLLASEDSSLRGGAQYIRATCPGNRIPLLAMQSEEHHRVARTASIGR